MVIVYAFRAPEQFSSGMYLLKAAQSDLGTVIIRFPGEKSENPWFRRGRNREKRNNVSRLLKVVETQIWAQNNRNTVDEFMLALITTLSSQTFRFLVIGQKLKFPLTQHEEMQKCIYI